MSEESRPSMRTNHLFRPAKSSGPRGNYNREEFHLEVTTRQGTVATAQFFPVHGNTWECRANVKGTYCSGRATYPASAFNAATAARLPKLTGQITVIATDIDQEDHEAVGTTVSNAIENVYALMMECRGLTRLRR